MRYLLIIFIFISFSINQELIQGLSKEQEIFYNNDKISIERKTSYSWFYYRVKQIDGYNLYKGYEEISLREFAKLYGDTQLLNKILTKEESSKYRDSRTWPYFILGTSLLVFAQDENGIVLDGARPFAISSFCLSLYYYFKPLKNINHHIIAIDQIEDTINLYNNRLIEEIKNSQ